MIGHILVIGSGAREHALAWKLSQSPSVNHIYVSPGNAGTQTDGKFSNCDVDVKDHATVASWCKTKNISLVVVGPEDPLANGLADYLKNAGIKCFGPCQKGAQIEASKEFAKIFMDKYDIPTARWKSFKNAKEAQDHISSAPYDALVVKASGLAAGKGVIVGKNNQEAIEAVDTLKQDKGLSAASDTIVIEELLAGEEVSVLCFSDGTHISVMPPAQDHKRLLDNDDGPNTGGMGAYCRCPLVSDDDMKFISENILQRTIDGMRAENSPYVGVLYAGLMLTKDGPKVLEFNCRFGDPETQVILPLLESDLYAVMLSCVEGKLNASETKWSEDKHAAGVVVVSGGYPGSYEKGKLITGTESLEEDQYVVFHAGTSSTTGKLKTSGGRVLTVVAVRNSLEDAASAARLGAGRIHFEGAFYRKDIARKGLQKFSSNGLTYKSAGVDIESADDLVAKIKSLTKETLRKEVCGGIGGFGGIFDLSGYVYPYLVSKVGSIGEKLKMAQDCRKYRIIGNDLVAESINEILCFGAEPLFFLDTFTCGKLDVEIAAEVITGIATACKEANCALIGGETAEMPGMYHESDFDLTSFARGSVEKSQLLPRKLDIHSGDIAIGLVSSALNHNCYRTVKSLMAKHNLTFASPAPFVDNQTLQDVLLAPRTIYVHSVLPLMRRGLIKAATFINEGGLAHQVQQILQEGQGLAFDASKWEIPPIYSWIAKETQLSVLKMALDFNCGLDMVLIVDKFAADDVLKHLKACDQVAAAVGTVKAGSEGHAVVEVLNVDFDVTNTQSKKKVAVLSSEKGVNLKALIEHTRNPIESSVAEIVVVVSDSSESRLKEANAAGIPFKVLDFKMTPENIEASLNEILSSHSVDIVCLDYFPMELSREFLSGWKGRVLDVRPSLLPAYDGPEVHQEVLNLGARITGCTVYFLEADGLAGKIIEQAALNVEVSETVDTLQSRVNHLESTIYPRALELVASGKHGSQSNSIQFENECPRTSAEDLKTLNEAVHALMKSTTRPGFQDCNDLTCAVFDLKASGYQYPYLISGTDGVGTKLKIAQICNKHDTIGIDLVAMCVNDILTHGAEPLFFLESFDCGHINPETVVSAISGIAEGCLQANCALIAAEVNELPEIYLNSNQCIKDFDKYDVVGYAEGALNKKELLPRVDKIAEGDVLIGIASSGVHSNGFSLVRKLVEVKKFRYQDPFPLDKTKTLQEVLLEPTKIYVKSVLPLIKKGYVKAAAHITGGGLTQNIPRVLPPHLRVELDGNSWDMPLVLQWIAMEGQLSKEEMLQTFNCGLGMVLIVDKAHEKDVLTCLEDAQETASTVGHVSHHKHGNARVQVKNFNLPKSSSIETKKKVGVLISGSGTNLQALIDSTQDPKNCSSVEIVLVVSNIAGVEGLNRATKAGIPTKVVNHKDYKKRVEFDMAVHALLKESNVEIVCLAGFMRIVSKEFVQLWQGNLLNVHPSILPAFKGMNAHKQVLEIGAKITGCSVHFVETEVDAGAIIEQAAVRVDPKDDEKTLQEKVKVLEHKIFPSALELLGSGRVSRGSDGKLKWHF